MSEPLCYLCKQTGHEVLAHRMLGPGKGICRDHFQGAIMPVGTELEIEGLSDQEIERTEDKKESGEENNMAKRKNIDQEKLKTLHGQGLPDRKIGEQLGCSAPTICNYRKVLGLKPNRIGKGARKLESAITARHHVEARITLRMEEDAPTIIASAVLCDAIWDSLSLARKAALLSHLADGI